MTPLPDSFYMGFLVFVSIVYCLLIMNLWSLLRHWRGRPIKQEEIPTGHPAEGTPVPIKIVIDTSGSAPTAPLRETFSSAPSKRLVPQP